MKGEFARLLAMVISLTLLGCAERVGQVVVKPPKKRAGIAAIRHLDLIPADADYIGYLELQDFLRVARRVVPRRLLELKQLQSIDNALAMLRAKEGVDLRRIAHVTVAGTLGEGQRFTLLTSAAGFDTSKLQLREDSRGSPRVYRLLGGLSVTIIGGVAIVGASRRGVQWVIDRFRGKSRPIREYRAALEALHRLTPSLKFGRSQLYVNMSRVSEQVFGRGVKVGFVALSLDPSRGANGVLVADPTAIVRISGLLNEGLGEARREWGRFRDRFLAEKAYMKLLGTSLQDVKRLDAFVGGLHIQRDGNRFMAEVAFNEADLKSYAPLLGVLLDVPRPVDPRCQRACKKLVECELMKSRDKCLAECAKELKRRPERFDREYNRIIAPHLHKPCDQMLKEMAK